MTALDDALNSGAPQYEGLSVTAEWKELPPTATASTNQDSPHNLTSQLGAGGWSVSHSFEDGLPDTVTMTTSSDASGQMTAELVGKPGVYADVLGWRTSLSGTGSASGLPPTPFPAGTTWEDYCIFAITLAQYDIEVTELSGDWDLLNKQADGTSGSGLITYVYGSRWYSGLTGPDLDWLGTVAYSYVMSAAYAQTADGNHKVRIEPDTDNVVSTAEDVSVTNHAAPATSLKSRRGWLVGIWSSISASAQWSAPAGHTELGEAAATVDVMMSTSPLVQPTDFIMVTASTSAATAMATKAVVPLRVHDREDLLAYQYFSPFYDDSPVYGYDRHSAPVEASFGVSTADGTVSTSIFKGQMGDIGIREENAAELVAYSKARVDLNRSVNLPKIWGFRKGMSVDWLATYMMAQGGQFVGPAPTQWARWWNPYYGSIQPMLTGPMGSEGDAFGFDYVYAYSPANFGVAATGSTEQIEGPNFLGMFAEQTLDGTTEIYHDFEFSQEPMPHQLEQNPNWEPEDLLSQRNMAGRISFWIKMDPFATPPGGGGIDVLIEMYLARRLKDNSDVARLSFLVRTGTDVYINMRMDEQYFFWPAPVGPIPQDGQWHFVGVKYDFLARRSIIKLDGVEDFEYAWDPSPYTARYPATDEVGLARGDKMTRTIRSHVPVADFQWEIGRGAYDSPWTDLYPPHHAANAPGSYSATTRPTGYLLEGLFNDLPYPVWDTLTELAQATASWYRVDESDGFNFLPLEYFGEPSQLTSAGELDTSFNAQRLEIIEDPSKQRNVVTVKFLETRIDTATSAVFTLTSALTIPRGQSEITFALDRPIVEAWSELNPGTGESGNWTLDNMTAAHASGATPLPTTGHYIFFNRNADGSGEYLKYIGAQARLMKATATTMTVRFRNTARLPVYVVNNGQDKPFMVLRGIGVTQQEAYVTVRDDVGVRTKGERSLEVELPWVQNRSHALDIANRILGVVHQARHQMQVRVMGDPRRKPGQLFTVKDTAGTKAAGTWRAISIKHEGAGAQYTQLIDLIRVGDVFTWDVPGWDKSVWGE